MKRRQQ
jgi:hypothetical protein